MSRARTLSHRIEAIEYIHAGDGRPYRHDFTRGDSDILLRKDGSVVIRNKNRKLWDTFSVDGRSQPFLVNPRGKHDHTVKRRRPVAKKRRKARARRRPMTAAQARYFAPKRRSNPRRRRHHTRAAAPVRHHRRRRNPPLVSLQGLLQRTMSSAIDGAFVTGGKLGVRMLSKRFNYADGSMMDSLIEIAGAVALGIVGPRLVGQDRARFLMAGGFDSVYETFLAQTGNDTLSTLLGKTMGARTALLYPAADSPTSFAAPARNLVLSRLGAYGAGGRRAPNLSFGPRLGAYALPSTVPMQS